MFIVSGTVGFNNNSFQNISLINQFEIKAYPNPFVNSITLSINGDAGNYKLILTDALGRIIWTKIGTKTQGNIEQSLNTSALQRGMYFLKLIQNDNKSTIKLVK